MPRTVDHEQRRTQIADAAVRLAGREGLHAVSMRAVAAEAGISLHLVQYYFGTKAELIHAGLRHLERQSNERWAARLAALPQPVSARAYLEAFFEEALPTDDVSRTFHLVGASYAVLAMTDPDLADLPFVAGLSHLEKHLDDALRRGQADGSLPAGLDPAHQASVLVALNHGIGTTVMIGQRTAEEARTVLQRHLAALFDGGTPHASGHDSPAD
ncbi:TetR/AcrR family transcriptional regulator [Streptomyces oceani]|uniref:TetR family transcriptional regulator n=1 Tax=Streptomyces oceani TaxID=1075402 RepID=A0A1E7KLS5_9ACTN|nr:TetR/AcrR family transcriptional regulator [Streptomyces oceani]OEV04856.1 TetR family transcriptional regulator [Streptomyces oceani]